MTNRHHRALMPMLAVLLGLLTGASDALTLKFATVAPEGTAWMTEMRAAAERIEQRTGGAVSIKYYPGGVMGSADTVLRKMRVGQLHGGAFTSGELAGRYSDVLLYSIPFLFDSEEEVAYVRKRLDPLMHDGLQEQGGLVMLGAAGGGFVYLLSDHRVVTADDLASSKVWTPEGDSVSDHAFRLAGVSPVPLALPDVYTALQTGVIDTVVNTTAGAIAFQWHTKMRYMADFPVAYVVGMIVADQRHFSRLKEPHRKIVREEFDKAFNEIERINLADVDAAREALVNQGITILPLNDEQRQRWHDLGRELVADLGTLPKFQFELLDQLLEFLAEYRQQAQP